MATWINIPLAIERKPLDELRRLVEKLRNLPEAGAPVSRRLSDVRQIFDAVTEAEVALDHARFEARAAAQRMFNYAAHAWSEEEIQAVLKG